MGNILGVIDDASEKRPRWPPCDFRGMQRVPKREVYKPGSWTSDRAKVERRKKRWKQKKFYSAKIEEFALSRSMFDPGARISWECTEVLGAGSFGVVGLWQQLRDGGPIDSVAVKEIDARDCVGMARCRDYTIPMEAMAMSELRRGWSVPQLRQLMFLSTTTSTPRWRMYQEYCQHGTVRDIVKIYKRFNEMYPDDWQIIPEAYVWYVFRGLAVALHEMDHPKFSQLDPSQLPWPGHRYVLHLDIKDDNVLLAEPFKNKALSDYPVVKLVDWGLAELTNQRDPRNSKKFKSGGTPIWNPPEQKHENEAYSHWRNPIHGHIDRAYTSAHTLWQMAAIIFGLMTLDEHNSILHERIAWAQSNEHLAQQRNYELLQWEAMVEDDYSWDLLELVLECLNIDPRRRPSPDALMKRTGQGLERIAKKLYDKGKGAPPVFYGKRGLEDMERYVRPGRHGSDPNRVRQRRRERRRERAHQQGCRPQ